MRKQLLRWIAVQVGLRRQVGDIADALSATRPASLERLAQEVALLIVEEPIWIHRRVEQITFLDSDRTQRVMSVDLTLPDLALIHGRRPLAGPQLLPLAQPTKTVLKGFDLRDGDGHAVPVLTLDENSLIACALLVGQATQLLNERRLDFDEAILPDLRDVVGARHNEADRPDHEERFRRAADALRRFQKAALNAPAFPTSVDRLRAALWLDPGMHGLLRTFATRFILLAEVAGFEPGMRSVFKLTYEEPPERPPRITGWQLGRRLGRLAQRIREELGWRDARFEFSVRAIFAAESYHVELTVPDELAIRSAELGVRTNIFDVATGEEAFLDTPLATDAGASVVHLYQSGVIQRAGANFDPLRFEVTELGYIKLRVRLKPSVMFAPLAISAVTSGVLLGGWIARVHGVHPHRDAATALLVVLPALFGAYLVPGEHRLVRRLYRGLRLLVLLAALTSFAAASLLAMHLPHNWTYWSWVGLLLVSVTSTAAIVFAVVRSKWLN